MNKGAAQLLAKSETMTIGDLRRMISAASQVRRMSKVNPTLTLQRVCEIYSAAIEDRDEKEIPKAWKPDIHSRHPGAQRPSRDFLLVTNILWDCGKWVNAEEVN